MLKELSIKNLAIIENIDVVFKDGFTVLSGETGAGKSLMIDSLSLLLGARASSQLIREGEEKAIIKGLFVIHSPQVDSLLSKLDVPFEDGNIQIERIISRSKSSIKVNGVSINLNDLEALGNLLANIHNQFDFTKILNPENYLEIIDGFSYQLTSSYKKEYQEALGDYQNKKGLLLSLEDRQKKIQDNRDFYQYQYDELKGASLKEGEQEEIASKISLLRNHDQIYSLSMQAKQIIDDGVMDKLYELDKISSELSKYQDQYKPIHDSLDEKYYEVDDLLKSLVGQFDEEDYDPNSLNDLEQRDSDLDNLKRKYKKDIPELIAYRDELSSGIGENSSLQDEIDTAKANMDEAFKKVIEKGNELTQLRKKISKSIEKELEGSLHDLLLDSVFQIAFINQGSPKDDTAFYQDGLDQVDFLIETNIGEGLKSLSKVVSGGEASRIMLSFKALFIKANKISTVVFDEIDTGLSGRSAEAMANKIHEISLFSQVIAITHTPQLASISDHHLLLEKEVKGSRTYTHIKELNLEEKIEEVAYLISDGKVSEKQLEYAKEMVLRKRT